MAGRRVFASLFRLGAAAALVVLGATALVQVALATPSGASGSTTELLAWGDNSLGELGDGSTTESATPVAVDLPSGVTPTALAAGGGGGDPLSSQYAAYAIGSDGNLYAWGDNSSGQLGTGSTTASDTPVVVSLPVGVTPTAISASQGSAYAIGSDKKLYAWGTNEFGNLGNGNTTDSDTPVVVSLPAGVTPTSIAGGYESAYAVGSDGNLYAWGDNTYGELGNGSAATLSDTPVVVSLPAGVTPESIAGAGGAAYAIGSDGNLYAWGLNTYGELGNDTTANSTTPVVVMFPPGVTAKSVTGGGGFAHAIGSDGKLYGWGLDDSGGQLGDGATATNTDTPIVISLGAGVTPRSITDNLHTGYAVGSDGKLYAWGYGLAGELGDGGDSDFSPPVAVSLPSNGTVQSLGQEPGSAAGYAIVNIPYTAPSVTFEPADQTVYAGQSATFYAAAVGYPAPTIQWQVSTDDGSSFSPISGATSDIFTIASTTLADNGNEYEAVFSNGTLPDATTSVATLTVNPTVAPVVTTNPVSQTAYVGQMLTFTVAASGVPAPTVYWQLSTDGGQTWASATWVTTDSITSGPLASWENGWELRAVFTNAANTVTTAAATLTVLPAVAPVVTTEPMSQTASVGQMLTFTVAASGTPAPSVYWQLSTDGGQTWASATWVTTDSISSGPLTSWENGWELRAVFTNGGGTAITNVATLTVT